MDQNNKTEINKNKIRFLYKALKFRINIITIIYQAELFNEKIDSNEIFKNQDLSASELKVIEEIALDYDRFIKVSKSLISSEWEWERISPLTRAIIIYGEYEMLHNDKLVVINEMVKITKNYVPNNDYKFVNKVLDMFAKKINK
ncbi:transcription antitermination factor NusB [Mycoplasma struthionis]|uniref:Transcription antitermination protein NusB n=1 Tax=Mycoplasma struthionis TaxID=538220 RepID=A0A3G8LGU8_9MOLU|nr:transcription antitermination factor NusB [Mycoplasma struthionis]AZG68896.1 transcription antitermination protein NusB [Mycoplasma struthionis]